MLLRAWMGANEAAIAMRIPDHFSACTAVSRERADALAVAGDDDLEVAVHERALGEEPLAVHRDAGVGVARDVLGPVVEAGPGRGHGVGVDVVQQVLDAQVLHAQVELAARAAGG